MMMPEKMEMIKNKNIGDYKINLLQKSSVGDILVLSFWSKNLGKEIYNTGVMQKNKAIMLYNNMNTEPKIKMYLQRKIKLTPSMLRLNW